MIFPGERNALWLDDGIEWESTFCIRLFERKKKYSQDFQEKSR
jgi:hypothetical protein